MKIQKSQSENQLTLSLSGRLDIRTTKNLEDELRQDLHDVRHLVIDMKELDYLASAGLRVLTAAQRIMNRQGEMVILNPNETIREVFEVTGLADVFTICA